MFKGIIVSMECGDHRHIAGECPDCVQSSGYVRVSKPGQFATYEKCKTCGGSGVFDITVPLQIPEAAAPAVSIDRPLSDTGSDSWSRNGFIVSVK